MEILDACLPSLFLLPTPTTIALLLPHQTPNAHARFLIIARTTPSHHSSVRVWRAAAKLTL